MKKTLALSIFFAGSAMAAEMPIELQKPTGVEESVTKITCSHSIEGYQTDRDGKMTREKFEGKATESIRTSWKEGDVEYRFSEYKGFGVDGQVDQIGRSFVEVTVSSDGTKVVEKGRSVTRWAANNGRLWSNMKHMRSSEIDHETVYEIQGNKKTVIAFKDYVKREFKTSDGVGDTEVEYPISEDKVLRVFIKKTPYTLDFGNGFSYTEEKSQTTCLYEKIK